MDRESAGREDIQSSWRSLRSDVRRRVRDGHAADDIVQEAWLRALQNSPEKNGRFRGWLHVVSLRLIYEAARARRRRGERERDAAKPEHVEAQGPANEDSRVLRMMEGLPETYREVLRLRFVEEVETAEIARRLGRSPGTVRSQIKRGLDLMRARLDGRRKDSWTGSVVLVLVADRMRGTPRNAGGRWAALLVGAACLILAITYATRSAPASGSAASVDRNVLRGGSEGPATSARAGSSRRAELPSESTVPPGAPPGVAGTVLDASGRPVAGAAVYSSANPKDSARLEATTDEQGRFAIPQVAPQRILWAEHPDWMSSSRMFLGTAPDPLELELTLPAPSGSSRLHLVWADGTDVKGALVRFERVRSVGNMAGTSSDGRLEFAPRPSEVRTDASGRAGVDWENEGLHRITVASAEFPAWRHVTEVEYAREEELRIDVPRPMELVGRVVDEAGQPVAQARVELLEPDESVLGEVAADDEGRFEFSCAPKRWLRVRASAPGPCGASCLYEGIPEAGSELELVVSERFTICGTANDSGALAGWTVRLVRLQGPAKVLSVRVATTDVDGRFAFHGCALDADLRVDLLEPAGEALVDWTSVTSERRDIRLVPTRRGRPSARVEIEFRARSRDETPLLVELRSNVPEQSLLFRPDPITGRFSTTPLWHGVYGAVVWLPRLGPWRVENVRLAKDETRTLVIEVPQAGRISAEPVIAAGGAEEVSVRVRIPCGFNAHGAGGSGEPVLYRVLVPEPDGRRFAGEFPPGDYRVEVFVGGNQAITREVHVDEGNTTRWDVVLEPGVPTTLRVVLPQGPPLGGESFQLTVETTSGSKMSMPLVLRRDVTDGVEFPVLLSFDATRLEVTSTHPASRTRRTGRVDVPPGFARSASRPTIEVVAERHE